MSGLIKKQSRRPPPPLPTHIHFLPLFVLEDAIKRLKSIVSEHLDQTTIDNFKALGEHRNQIVHFAHSDYADLSATKAGVVVEQWASWHHLHTLLTEKWKDVFLLYQEEFKRIHRRMMGQKDFILARYNELRKV